MQGGERKIRGIALIAEMFLGGVFGTSIGLGIVWLIWWVLKAMEGKQ